MFLPLAVVWGVPALQAPDPPVQPSLTGPAPPGESPGWVRDLPAVDWGAWDRKRWQEGAASFDAYWRALPPEAQDECFKEWAEGQPGPGTRFSGTRQEWVLACHEGLSLAADWDPSALASLQQAERSPALASLLRHRYGFDLDSRKEVVGLCLARVREAQSMAPSHPLEALEGLVEAARRFPRSFNALFASFNATPEAQEAELKCLWIARQRVAQEAKRNARAYRLLEAFGRLSAGRALRTYVPLRADDACPVAGRARLSRERPPVSPCPLGRPPAPPFPTLEAPPFQGPEAWLLLGLELGPDGVPLRCRLRSGPTALGPWARSYAEAWRFSPPPGDGAKAFLWLRVRSGASAGTHLELAEAFAEAPPACHQLR